MSNDNTESISAKMRRWANESERLKDYPVTVALNETRCSEFYVFEEKAERDLFHHIADEIDREKREITELYARQSWMNPADAIAKLATGEIEWAELRQSIDRYYLPRPLFDDGEPVQFGDETDLLELVDELSFFADGSVTFGHNGNTFKVETGERVKRPEPQVLDADGVPIEVGDAVWNVFDDQKRTVIGFRDGKAHTQSKSGLDFFEGGHELTHREPDSLEKLLERMEDYAQKNEGYVDGSKVGYFSKELRALIELDGRDA